MKKVTEFHEIPRNFTELYDMESCGIPQNFSQFRTEYGIGGSKKNRRNSVSTVDGIPWTPYFIVIV